MPVVAWFLILAIPASAAQTAPPGVRMILVKSETEAVELRARIDAGASFEQLAREHSLDASAAFHGYLGRMNPADLRPEFRNALAGVDAGQISPVAAVGGAYALLQTIPEAEQAWIDADAAAGQALQAGRLVEAAELYRNAIRAAESLGSDDYRQGESLNSLAAVYRLREDWSRAAAHYRRSLEIREIHLGMDHLDVATSLNNLAEVERFRGNDSAAEPLYRRSLSILEQALGPDHANVARSLNNLAQLLEARRDFAGAEPLLRRALGIAEGALGPGHVEVAASLNNLARVLEAQGDAPDAAPLYGRSLSILERALGPDHPNVAASVASLGRVARAEGDPADAARLFRRALDGGWGQASADVVGLLDRFSGVMRLAYFLDAEFDAALGAFLESLAETPVRETLYYALSALLVEVAREDEAEAVMLTAVEAYPDSWRARYELAEVFVESMKLQRALDEMRRALAMRARPAPDARQQSFVHQRIGDIQSELLQFDAAESEYRTSVEIDPDRIESRLALGDLYLRNNRVEEALEEYAAVVALDPENAAARTAAAAAYLRTRQLEAAVASAEAALELDPDAVTARYHRARALIQMGRRDEGQSEVQAYQRLQAEEQASEDRARDVYVLNRDAADAWVAGEPEVAQRLFREGIGSHPSEAAFRFNLAVARSRMGRHAEAIETLEAMIAMDIGDDFLARRELAGAYAALGDAAASERESAAYLEAIEAALRSRVE